MLSEKAKKNVKKSEPSSAPSAGVTSQEKSPKEEKPVESGNKPEKKRK